MAHPFTKFFDKALLKSTEEDNCVLKEAIRLKDKGYNPVEIHALLVQLQKGLIDDKDATIAAEAAEEFMEYL